jgi:hypothetical protein
VVTNRTIAKTSILEEVVASASAETTTAVEVVVPLELALEVINSRDRASATTSRLWNANSLNKNRDVPMELTALSLMDQLSSALCLVTRTIKEVAVTAVVDSAKVAEEVVT